MELAYYSDYAVRLVNTEEPARGKDSLTSVDAVRDLFGANQSGGPPRHGRRRHPVPLAYGPGCARSSRRRTAATRPSPWTC